MPVLTTDTTWALISERGVMAASVVYGLALTGYVAEWALSRRVAAGRSPVDELGPEKALAEAVPAGRSAGTAARSSDRGEHPQSRGGPRVGADPSAGDADPEGAPDPTFRDREPAPAPGSASSEAGTGFAQEFAGRLGICLTAVAALLHLGALVTRGLAAHRVPWGNMYEFALAGSFGAVLLYLVLSARIRLRWLGLPLCALVLVTLMTASLTLYVPAGPLVPALQSYWLVIHVVAAVTATGAFTLGALTSVLYLVRSRRDLPQTAPAASTRRGLLPDADAIDQISYRIHAFAFPVWTFAALIAGPIWAKYAWGRYWGWDPKEVWAFVTWVVYAAYLHARATGGWRGRRAAVVALIGFTTVLFNFVGINMFGTGLHSYSGL